MEVKLDRKEGLNAILSVEVAPEDYREELEKGIKEYQKKINLPGFRKGKVPSGIVKKMAGEELRREKINQIINQSIQNYIEENKIELILNPLEKREDNKHIDWNEDKTFNFTYDVGLKPDIDIKEEELKKLPRYKVQVEADYIDEEIDILRKQRGNFNKMEEITEDENVNVNYKLSELDENGEPLEGGLVKNKMSLLQEAPAALKEKFLGKKSGDKFEVKIRELFDSEEELEKYLEVDPHTLKDLNEVFEAEVLMVFNFDKADLNEEFFKGIFPDKEISNEEDFKKELKHNLEHYYEHQADSYLFKLLKEKVIKDIEVDLPGDFLKKWFDSVSDEKQEDEKASPEERFDRFREDIKWLTVVDHLAKENEIDIKSEEVFSFSQNMIKNELMRSGMGDIDQEKLMQYTLNYLQEQSNYHQAYYSLKEGKVFDSIKGKIDFEEKEIGREEFDKLKNELEHKGHTHE